MTISGLATLTETARVPATGPVPSHWLRRALSRAGALAGETLVLLAIVLAFPLVILAIGIPIALLVRILLWLASLP